MKQFYSLFILLFSAFILPISTKAQITITPGVAATVMANKLAGPGVVVINAVLTCPSNAYGIFSGTSSLSFDSGIVLTNGQAATSGTAIGAGGPASGFASTDNLAPGDAQLTTLAGQPTNDACILEFDFRPIGDTVKFEYVFGSEEYTDFTCSDFNDVFGFFISGPGFGGSTNIALVPGSTIPVCINSVNCGGTGGNPTSTCNALGAGSPFCAYYVDNSAGTTITYDGLTTTLTAIAHVTPCDTYHLKIGIADAVDDILDSGVFLKAGSLTSISIGAASLGMNPTDTGFSSQFCIRGCTPGLFVFYNQGSEANPITVHYIIEGTGVNGTDYTTIADSAIIPAHDSTDTVFIHALTTGSGTKTVKLLIIAPYTCGGLPVIIDSVELTILDSIHIQILTSDTTICIGQDVLINTLGFAGLNYTWSPASSLNNSTLLNPTATPTITTTYTITGTLPGAGCPPAHSSIIITVVDSVVVHILTPDTSICIGQHVLINTCCAGLSFVWSPASTLDNATLMNPTATPTISPTTYVVTATLPGSACPAGHSSVTISITEPPILNVGPAIQKTCVGVPLQLDVTVVPSTGTYGYSWSPAGWLNNPAIANPKVTPLASGDYEYTVHVTTAAVGCDAYDSFLLHVLPNDFTLVSPDTGVCYPSGTYQIIAFGDTEFTYSWLPITGVSNPNIIDPTITPSGNTTYSITATYPACPNMVHTILYYIENPIVNIIPSDTVFCVGLPVPIKVMTYPVDSPYTLLWSPGTLLSDPTLLQPNFYSPVMGDFYYHLTIHSSLGCTSTDSMHLHVLPNDYTLVSPDTGVCYPPSAYQIIAFGDTEFSYQWSPTVGVSDPNSITPTITPPYNLTYSLTASYPGCPNMVHTILYYIENPIVNIIPSDTSFCIGSAIEIGAYTLPIDSPYTLTWYPTTLLADATVLQPFFFSSIPGAFTYYLTITSGLGCTSTDSVIMRPSPPTHIEITPNSATIMYGDHVQLQAINSSPYFLYYNWVPDNGTLNNTNISTPIATPTDTVTTYMVYVMNEWGCKDSTSVTINLEYPIDCLPSAFTPNNDGLNDVFRLCSFMQYQKLVDFKVFNRWGQMVYENTADPKQGWDGTFNGVPQDMGIYNYVIIIAKPDGENKVYKGDVTLIR